jgi:hypothetical protein
MLRKALKGLLIGGALLGMTATAQAADYQMNMYGASAQYKFWLNLAPDFLTDAAGGACTAVTQCEVDSKNGIAVGTGCTFATGGPHTITVRYSNQASVDGIVAVNDTNHNRNMANNATCSALALAEVNLGASDVAYDRFGQQTRGWSKGNLNYTAAPSFPYVRGPWTNAEPDEVFNPIVVPFAFFANNSVCKFRCTRPELVGDTPVLDTMDWNTQGAHKSYGKDMWECDPDLTNSDGTNPQCIGFFKCLGGSASTPGTCNGGVNAGNSCTKNTECPDVALANTRCEAMPLDNINHAMAGQIYSGQVDDWSDFGPYFCPGTIQKIQRHEGSGTHATTRDLLQPYGMINDTTLFALRFSGFNASQTIHYESSSDNHLAVADFEGAIGYFDADKSLGEKYWDGRANGTWVNGTTDLDGPDGIVGLHIMKYNGVEPTRQKIRNGEYEYWAAQHVYYNNNQWTNTTALPARNTLLTRLIAFSSNASNLTSAELGDSADFWAAQSEMLVHKTPLVKTFKDRIDR